MAERMPMAGSPKPNTRHVTETALSELTDMIDAWFEETRTGDAIANIRRSNIDLIRDDILRLRRELRIDSRPTARAPSIQPDLGFPDA